MVLDLKKIDLKKEVQDDALWVIEQIPGYVCAGGEKVEEKKKKKKRPTWGSNPRPSD